MKALTRLARPLGRRQSGFTLVELLVVVGIIVALAAVIIPNIIQFAGRGETGARAAELDNVQTAMDAMMADRSVTTVTANTTLAAAVQDFTAKPVAQSATGQTALYGATDKYLRENPTRYWYCWPASGVVTQLTAAGPCP